MPHDLHTPYDADEEASTVYDTDDLIAYIRSRQEAEARAELEVLEELELDEDDWLEYDSLAKAPELVYGKPRSLFGLSGYQWAMVVAVFLGLNVVALAVVVRLLVML
ncbi:MAG: hypothetical protein EP330_04590 [Deltaproteobacteria bacterium]|nr:MAG: hypothetical protein EP330_04590 [Deltaproteobacteria bacterium]